LVAFAGVATAACDDGNNTGTALVRGVSSPSAVVSALVVPSTALPFQILPVSGCPFAPPFGSRFAIRVDGGGVPLILNDAAFQFFDARGFASSIFFSRQELTVLFGSTTIAAHGSRTFAFQPRFGCGFAGTPHLMSGRIGLIGPDGDSLMRTVKAGF
jgi:hypothetical protein